MKNILYHFTNPSYADKIKKQGLLHGKTPIIDNGKIAFLSRTQWLTVNSEPDQQTWATRGRSKAVVKVNIPVPLAKQNLIPFSVFYEAMKDRLPDGFNGQPEITNDWYVYIGVIPPQWIVNVRKFTDERVGGEE